MTEEVFKAPKKRKIVGKVDYEHQGSLPPRRKKTKEDFFMFCTVIMEYTQYEAQRSEDLRSNNNRSPLDSSGSTAESYTSDTTLSAGSPTHQFPGSQELNDSEEESELITCFCMKPYAGRPMIECSECETWIHFSCAKIRKNNVPEVYTCQLCRDSKFTARKSNRVRTENNKFTT